MPFWRCYYHVVWATKHREPFLTSIIERIVFRAIEQKSTDMKCQVLAVNAVPDHIHVAVTMPPTITVADWVKMVKGTSSREVKGAQPETSVRCRWQESYGVHTFGAKNLPWILNYIQRQKEHHASGQIESYLEQIDD